MESKPLKPLLFLSFYAAISWYDKLTYSVSFKTPRLIPYKFDI